MPRNRTQNSTGKNGWAKLRCMQPSGPPQGNGPPQQPYPQQPYPQQPGMQQPYPQQQGMQQQAYGPSSGILLTSQHNPLQWMLHFVDPVILINGHKVPLKWGTVPVPVPPGQHHIMMYFPWILMKACQVQSMVVVQPGHMTVCHYETAFLMFSAGTFRVLSFHPTGM